MKLNKTFFLSMIVVALVAAGGIGYSMWNKPHEDLTAAPADFTLASTDLYSAYTTDEAAANESYLGKTVELTGTVSEKKEEGGRALVLLEIPGELFGINCAFEPEHAADVQSIESGQSITLRGKVDGYTLDVALSRCILIN